MADVEEKVSKKRKQTDKVSEEELKIQNWREWKRQKKQQHRQWKEENAIKKLCRRQEKMKKEKEKLKNASSSTKQNHKGRTYTLSIAVPSTILKNAQSKELRTYLAGQIARAAAIFNVDEIVVFDDEGTTRLNSTDQFNEDQTSAAMVRILEFLECPQYLRKIFFPIHSHLTYAGLLNPLDCPHHLRADEESEFREGVVTKNTKQGVGSYVNVGLTKQEVLIDKILQPGVRVTVRLLPKTGKKLKGMVVSSETPREEGGCYWGYKVRSAESLGAVFSGCPYEGGYDVTIGTSDRGDPIEEAQLQPFNHLIVVFGGLKGLEASLEADERLEAENPHELFNHYMNACPSQGSRTIRTEEAILITLAALKRNINDAVIQRNKS